MPLLYCWMTVRRDKSASIWKTSPARESTSSHNCNYTTGQRYHHCSPPQSVGSFYMHFNYFRAPKQSVTTLPGCLDSKTLYDVTLCPLRRSSRTTTWPLWFESYPILLNPRFYQLSVYLFFVASANYLRISKFIFISMLIIDVVPNDTCSMVQPLMRSRRCENTIEYQRASFSGALGGARETH